MVSGLDLARAPRRARLTARKKGSGYENGFYSGNKEKYSEKYKSLVDRARKGTENDAQECLQFPPCWLHFLRSSQPSML